MKSDELYDLFRTDVVDATEPYLWSDTEVYAYMNDAYRMFVRLIGGVPDHFEVPIITDEPDAAVPAYVLKFLEARLLSTGAKLDIINYSDMPLSPQPDYGNILTLYLNPTPGPVRYVIVGNRKRSAGTITWVQTPQVDDDARFFVYRLPTEVIVGAGQEFDDIGEEHHEHLMLWMKHRAYGKHDAETFDKSKSDFYKLEFERYCAFAKAEWERYKTKVRVVRYGGL